MSRTIRPLASRGLLAEELLDGELLLYDERRHFASCLNPTAALVWRSIDGTRTVRDLVEVLRRALGALADEDLVMATLDQLDEQGLIESGYPPREPHAAELSRRRFVHRVGVAGAAAWAWPAIQSIAAPTPAQAASLPTTTTTALFTSTTAALCITTTTTTGPPMTTTTSVFTTTTTACP